MTTPATRRTRRLAAAGALGLVTLAGCAGPSASAAPAAPAAQVPSSSCSGVFQGNGDGELTKSVTSVARTGDGSYTVTFTVDSPRPDGTYRLRDCAFVDSNSNKQYDEGESLFAIDDKQATLSGGAITAAITVRGNEGDTVCDRAALSSDRAGYTDKSNTVCTTLAGDPVPVSAAGGLGLAAVALAALLLVQRHSTRRRQDA